MPDQIYRDGDKITITKGPNGWRAEMIRGKKPDGSDGGILHAGMTHPDPETALKQLRQMIER